MSIRRANVGQVSTCRPIASTVRSEEHTSELQSQSNLVCRLLLEKKKQITGRGERCGAHEVLRKLALVTHGEDHGQRLSGDHGADSVPLKGFAAQFINLARGLCRV